MSNPPPAKRLKQSSIVEALKKQRSIKEDKSPSEAVLETDKMAGCSKTDGFMRAGDEPMSQGSVGSMGADLNDSILLFSDSDLEDIPDPPPSLVKPTQIFSRGTPLSQMKTSPSCMQNLVPLSPQQNHTVLIKTPYTVGDACVPNPTIYKDKWDADHVKLPCSPENLYPVERKGGKSLKSRWELIETALLSDMKSSLDLEEAILKYNTRYNQKWNFHGLHSFFTEVLDQEEVNGFFSTTLPKMVDLALQLPELCTQPLPMLKKQMNHAITLSQKQVASLLINAFFCTFPRRNTAKKQSEYSSYPDINFSQLFQGSKHPKAHRKFEKLKCLLNYFRRVTNEMPNGTITFRRQCVKDLPVWTESSANLSRLHVASTGTIEDDGQGMLQVDFANKYLGGGVLGYGCVQEEIRFLICPDLILSRLFTEELDRNECLIMTGFETYSNYSGYADSFQWSGDHIDKSPRDSWGRRCTELVAIDALIFRTYVDQFHENLVQRELNKAYCGFLTPSVRPEHLPAVATGNWGCGAFGGDLRLKALIQIMAAAETHRDICYFTFENYELMEEIYKLHEFVSKKELSVSDLYNLIGQYYENICKHASRTRRPSIHLYDYIYSVYVDYGAETDSTDPEDNQTPADFDESSQEATSVWNKRDSPDYAADTP